MRNKISDFFYWLFHANKVFNPWTKRGLDKCEVCNKTRFKLVEVGLYWVCDHPLCIAKAAKMVEEDIVEFHRNHPWVQEIESKEEHKCKGCTNCTCKK